jgi:prephenate dehydrogenase
MAGSEKTGIEHAESDLFEGAAVILTPGPEVDPEDFSALQSFWAFLGGETSSMSAQAHDETVAAISHLPHLVASALIRSVMERDAGFAAFSGGGFRDTTRVAAGPAEMWTGILLDNHEALSGQLGAFIGELELWKAALDSLDSEQLRRFLSRSQELRSSI